MENASKALIMAASALIGVMIISIAVVLFRSFGSSGKSIISQIEESQLTEFNNFYMKYYGTTNTSVEKANGGIEEIQLPILITAHDIITLANSARQNNINYEIENLGASGGIAYNAASYYVQIDLKGKTNLEYKVKDENFKNSFLKTESLIDATEDGKTVKITKYFKVVEHKISDITKRVMYMKFEELTPQEYSKYYNKIMNRNIEL